MTALSELFDAEALVLRREACWAAIHQQLAAARLELGQRVLEVGPARSPLRDDLAVRVGPSGSVVSVPPGEDLPFEDASFDRAFCSHVAMSLSAEQRIQTIVEIRRVTRPGGLIVLREWDASSFRLLPAPPPLVWHLWDCRYHDDAHLAAADRLLEARAPMRLLERLGLEEVTQQVYFSDHWAPLSSSERAWLVCLLGRLAAAVRDSRLPRTERATWAAREDLLDDPRFACGEAEVVAVGRV